MDACYQGNQSRALMIGTSRSILCPTSGSKRNLRLTLTQSAFHEALIEALKIPLEVSRLTRCEDLEDQEEPGEVLEAAHPFSSLSHTWLLGFVTS